MSIVLVNERLLAASSQQVKIISTGVYIVQIKTSKTPTSLAEKATQSDNISNESDKQPRKTWLLGKGK